MQIIITLHRRTSMIKNLSYRWAFVVAFLFFFLQSLFIAIGMTLDNSITFFDYFSFFIAGLIIGAALIYLLRRSPTKASTRATFMGLIIGIPFALMGMFFGAPSGPFG